MSMRTAGPAPTSFLAGSVAQLRDAARHGASLATIFEHSSAHESRRAARIDPSSILAAWRDAADAARPIKSIRTRGYKGCGQADLKYCEHGRTIERTVRHLRHAAPRRAALLYDVL